MEIWGIIIGKLDLKDLMELCLTAQIFQLNNIDDYTFHSCLLNTRQYYPWGTKRLYPAFYQLNKIWIRKIASCKYLNPIEQSNEFADEDKDTICKYFFECISSNDLLGMKYLLSFHSKIIKYTNGRHIETFYPQIILHITDLLRLDKIYCIVPEYEHIDVMFPMLMILLSQFENNETIQFVFEWLQSVNDQVKKGKLSHNKLLFKDANECLVDVWVAKDYFLNINGYHYDKESYLPITNSLKLLPKTHYGLDLIVSESIKLYKDSENRKWNLM